MQYGIILTIDGKVVHEDYREFLEEHDWFQTEKGNSDLDDEWEHEKWCALLETDEEFKDFIAFFGLSLDGEGGAIGAPMPDGINFGPTPAYVYNGGSFDYEDLCAYVTPYPMPGEDIPGVNTFKRLPLFSGAPDGIPFDGTDWSKIGDHLAHIA